jgi:hypothetical protein
MGVPWGFESPHSSFSNSGRSMRNLRPIVQALVLSMVYPSEFLSLQALRASDPFKNEAWLRNHAAMIASPVAELIARLATDDAQAFVTSVRTAVDAQQQYYTLVATPGGIPHDPMGFICLSALACTVVAHDRGWSVPITSEYMPVGLIEGTTPKAPILTHPEA